MSILLILSLLLACGGSSTDDTGTAQKDQGSGCAQEDLECRCAWLETALPNAWAACGVDIGDAFSCTEDNLDDVTLTFQECVVAAFTLDCDYDKQTVQLNLDLNAGTCPF